MDNEYKFKAKGETRLYLGWQCEHGFNNDN
jgi:hypothetical protein